MAHSASFAVGGVQVNVQLQLHSAEPADTVGGILTFVGSVAPEEVPSVFVRLCCTLRREGAGEQCQDVVPAFPVCGAFVAEAGQMYQVPFEFQVPQDCPASVPESFTYAVHASTSDAPGDLGGAAVPLTIVLPSDAPKADSFPGERTLPGVFPGERTLPGIARDERTLPGIAPFSRPMIAGGMGPSPGAGRASYPGPAAGTLTPGSPCRVRWTDGQYYPATLVETRGVMCLIQWDNGTSMWVAAEQVRGT